MSRPTGFLTYQRELPESRAPEIRIRDYEEIYAPFPVEKTVEQASRCMDCGIPFCHNGCPLGNIIPEFNEAVQEENWQTAYQILATTNNFPEFTGRICPAPCEAACVLSINQDAVAIEHIEKTIIETAYANDWVKPIVPAVERPQTVAVVGSGPTGLAAASELRTLGYQVTVLERQDAIGGLLRYGIPDFKLGKWVIDRRLELMEASGIVFQTSVHVGVDISADELIANYDAVVLCTGATVPRDLPIPGRSLEGVVFAMDFLEQQNRRVQQMPLAPTKEWHAGGKNVVVIGGGDTGADCVGTSRRQGAATITQIELLAKPPLTRGPLSWPEWPMVLRNSSSHEEGCTREWAVLAKAFVDNGKGQLKGLQVVDVVWQKDPESGRNTLVELPDTLREIPCELALLAIGFLHTEKHLLVEDLGLPLDERGNLQTKNYRTTVPGVFAAGDARRGQSLVVWAIQEGRETAAAVHQFFKKSRMA